MEDRCTTKSIDLRFNIALVGQFTLFSWITHALVVTETFVDQLGTDRSLRTHRYRYSGADDCSCFVDAHVGFSDYHSRLDER